MNTKIYIDKGETWDDYNGSRLESGYEVNGIKEGVWEYFDFESEILIEKVTYKSGVRHGKAWTYLASDEVNYEYENNVNRVWIEEIYKNDELYKQTYYHDDGCYEVTHWKNDERHGYQTRYHSNGKVNFRRNIVNGRIEGFDKYFFENGQKKIICFFKNGLKQGKYESFQSDGNFLKRCSFDDGYISGLCINNHFNSKEIESKGSYIPLKRLISKNVLERIYNDYIFRESFLKKFAINPHNQSPSNQVFHHLTRVSLKDGLWEYYDKNGRLKTKVFYRQGQRVTREKFRGKNENVFNGPIKIYRWGRLHVEAILKDGDFDGSYKQYSSNGDLRFQKTFKNGKVVS